MDAQQEAQPPQRDSGGLSSFCRTRTCISHYDYGSTYGSLAWDEKMVCDDPEEPQPRRSPTGPLARPLKGLMGPTDDDSVTARH
jgi:hypothetical protein